MKALGLIEVNGYLAAVEAADAALKAASVTLIGLEVVKAGITCVQLTGDIGAVKASVDAGGEAASRLGLLRTTDVIARLHEETLKLFPKKFNDDEEYKHENLGDTDNSGESLKYKKQLIEVLDEVIEQKIDKEIEDEIEEIEKATNEEVKKSVININDEVVEKEVYEIAEEIMKNEEQKILEDGKKLKEKKISLPESSYSSLRVDELRNKVRKLNIPSITNKQIKFAKKDALIKILEEHVKEGEK